MKYRISILRFTLLACLVSTLLLSAVLWLCGILCDRVNADQKVGDAPHRTTARFIELLSEKERKWLGEHPVITVVQDRNWPPVEFVDESGELSGISSDYLKLVEDIIGFKFKRVPASDWQEAYSRLKKWEIDMTTSVAVTEDREKFWMFTKPYLNIPIIILTRSDVTYVGSIKDLEGKRVAAVDGYVSNEWIQRDFPGIQLVSVKNVLSGIELLQDQQVFALIDNMLVISYYLAKLKLTDLRIAGWTPYVNAQAMAVRKDWPELVGIIQKALDSIPETEINAVYQKWVPLQYKHDFDYYMLWKPFLVFSLILAGLLFWNHKLSREITRRHASERNLLDSEQRYRDLWEKAPVMMISLDTQGRIILASDIFCQHLGYDREEIIGRKVFEFQTASSATYSRAVVFPGFLEKGLVKDAPLQLVRKDGSIIDVVLNVTSEKDPQGRIMRSRSVYMDVTEQKRAEEALRESQSMYEDLVAGMPVGAYRFRMKTSGDWQFDFVSDQWCELNALDKSEVLRDPEVAMAHIHPDDRDDFIKLNKTALKTLNPFVWEGRIIVRGEIRYAHVESRPRLQENGDIVWNGVHTDLTVGKKAEEALRENEELLRGFFENAAGLVWVKDLNGRFLKVNHSTEKFLGLPQNKILGRTVNDLFPEDIERQYSENDLKALLGDSPSNFEEYALVEDGLHAFLSVKFPLRNAKGEVFGLGAICTDITDSKKSEMERQLLESAIEQAAEVVVITDVAGNIVYVNPAFERVTGYSMLEVIGKNTRILKSGEHDREFYQNLWSTIKRGEVWEGRFINRSKSGRVYYEDATISPVREPSGKIVNFVAVKRDVSEHLELSMKLQQAQKMEAVGTLAGGVAHDFNNILQVTLGYTDLMLNDAHLPEGYRSDLQKIRDSAVRGADLVQRLMTFSRKTQTNPQPINLNTRVAELGKILERTIPKMISIQLNLDQNLKTINADPTQIDQILFNLSVNARDAMPDGGSLEFQTANVDLDEQFADRLSDLKAGSYVMLRVSDSGSGIDKDYLEHIFEPFFTTKGVNQGTGLGLAIVHSVVQQHGGHISCESQPGKGTTFKILLPAFVSDEHVGECSEQPHHLGGSETILIVDDEKMVRDLSSRIMTRAGYRVIEASSGEEAIEIYSRKMDSIDLVALDLIMPGIGGKHCLEKLLEINRNVKVIIASGYLSENEVDVIPAEMVKGFIHKPFEMGEMLMVIRNALDS